MVIQVPKRVLITNPKLNLINLVVKVGTVVALLCYFVVARQYAQQLDIYKDITVTTWKNVPANVAAQAQSAEETSPFCTSPHDYDFWWDATAVWTYTNHTCMPICPPNATSFECLPESHVAMQTSSPSGIFVVTQIMDTFVPREGHSSNTSQRPKTANYFTMTPDLVGMGFQFQIDVTLPGFLSLTKQGSVFRGSSIEAIKGRNSLTTLILDASGNLWKKLPASPSIDLTVPQMLELSGHPNLLNEAHDIAGTNEMPGGMPGGPSSRISGLELDVTVECYEPHATYPRDLPDEVDGIDGPVCVVRVDKLSRGWVSEHIHEVLDAGVRSRIFHGIRVKVKTAGQFEVYDWNKIYLNLVSIIVMMALPEKLVFLFAVTCLGHMSVLYRRAVYEEFNVLTEVAGMTTRMVTNTAAFVDLEDVQRTGEKPGGISMERMAERMQRLLEYQTHIDPSEVQSLVRFCFKQVGSSARDRRALTLCQELRAQLQRELDLPLGRVSDGDAQGVIDIERFCDACSSSERIAFQAIVDLFDRHRPTTFLERFFTPRKLWMEIHESKREILTSGRSSMTMEEMRDHARKMQGEVLSSRPTSPASPTELIPEPTFEDLKHRLNLYEHRLSQLERCLQDTYRKQGGSTSLIGLAEERADATERQKKSSRIEESSRDTIACPGQGFTGSSGATNVMIQAASSLEDLVGALQESTRRLHMEQAALSGRLAAIENCGERVTARSSLMRHERVEPSTKSGSVSPRMSKGPTGVDQGLRLSASAKASCGATQTGQAGVGANQGATFGSDEGGVRTVRCSHQMPASRLAATEVQL